MIPRYTRAELAELWSDSHRYETWLRVELAACAEMEKAGTVPAGTAAAVRAKAAGKLDPARILEHEERTRHDVIAFLTHVEELAGEPARWLHLGMTSSDVLDAALAIQLYEAADQILAGIDELRSAEEIFLTSAARGVLPVTAVDGHPVGQGRPGPVTHRLIEAYARLTEGAGD